MSRTWGLVAFVLSIVAATAAPAQTRDHIVRCLQLAAIYERHVAKNAAHPLPSMPVDISVAIEGCRQGKADGAVEKLESALRAKGFRL